MMTVGEIVTAAILPHAIANGWIPEDLPEELQDQGFVGFRDLEDGNILAVLVLTFGRARLTYGPGPKYVHRYEWDKEGKYDAPIGYDGGFDKYWDFDSLELAIEAMRGFPESVGEGAAS
jgi:hypothetical protein